MDRAQRFTHLLSNGELGDIRDRFSDTDRMAADIDTDRARTAITRHDAGNFHGSDVGRQRLIADRADDFARDKQRRGAGNFGCFFFVRTAAGESE